MPMTVKAFLWTMIVLVLVPAAAGAQQVKKYTNDKHGFSVEYQAEWYIRDGSEELEISTAKDAFDADRPGAGISIMVKEAEAEDEGKPEKALARILGENDSEFTLGRTGTRQIGGKDWYSVEFSGAENGLEGEIYVLQRGVKVYFFGLFYKQPEAREMYRGQLEEMVASFRFPERKLKTYTDKARGLTFRYPDIGEVEEERESVTVIIEGGNPGTDDKGAAMTVGLIDASEQGMKDLDEKGFLDMLKGMSDQNDQVTIVSDSEPVTVMKTTWYKSAMIIEGKQVTFVLRRYGAYFFAAVLMVSPATAAGEYEKAFDVFLSSLSFDPKKWGASLNSKE